MQTIHYATSNFIRHEGKVIDLMEYRRKLAQTREDTVPVPDRPGQTTQPRPFARMLAQMGKLEVGASVSIMVMTLTFAVKILLV